MNRLVIDRIHPSARRVARLILLIVLIVAIAGPAAAQPPPSAPPAPLPMPPAASPPPAPPTLPAAAGCVRPEPRRPASAPIGPPVTWNDFEIEGELQDPPDTVRALFTPVMTRLTSLTDDARKEVAATAEKFAYAVVGLGTRETPKGTHAVLHLAPRPLVRKVNIDIKQSPFTTLLDDQVRRRMRIRTGTYLPWNPDDRACELDLEQRHIAEYLHYDEGYFDATVEHEERRRGSGLEITIRIRLGDEYTTGVIKIANPEALRATPIDQRAVIQQFQHDTCLFCFGASRFTRSRHLEDIQHVVELFQRRGYPAVRVHTSFEQDPRASFNRRTHAVDFTVTIDPRRQIDLKFDGTDDSVSDEQLREHLTFNATASSDDVEANNSARAIVQYLQSRGWFDAHVTWTRVRNQDPPLDQITFQVDRGKQRPVREIKFVGNRAFGADRLEEVIGTTQEKLTTSLFGGNTNATSAQLAADVDRILQFYRSAGYRDARVRVEAATDPAALGSAALTAALAATDRGDGLYVRYVIEEGESTLLTGVDVILAGGDTALRTPDERRLCKQVLTDLADLLGARQLSVQTTPDRCTAAAPDLKFREDDAALTRDQLKSRLYSQGSPRAEVGYEARPIGPHRVTARYTLTNVETLLIGKVVIRGNFKTRDSIILSELGLRRGAKLTQDALAEGARRLRNTALFDAVNVTMPDLETTRAGEVNAVVEVVERYDFLAQIDLEAGYSSYNGAFLKFIPSVKNLLGVGLSLDFAFTIGFDLANYINTNFREPKLSPRFTACRTRRGSARSPPTVPPSRCRGPGSASASVRAPRAPSPRACTTTSASASDRSTCCARSAPTTTRPRCRSGPAPARPASASSGSSGSTARARCRRSPPRTGSASTSRPRSPAATSAARTPSSSCRPPAPGTCRSARTSCCAPISGSIRASPSAAPCCCPRSSGSSPAATRPCAATTTSASPPRSSRSACRRSTTSSRSASCRPAATSA
ncbi:MAG: hypothetical protein E6J90_34485 [Deltaproteobacteria bacterium]|nr:MAG: hypothetical protein E6J90_34485 [Deltaproteobacteria bacterium]